MKNMKAYKDIDGYIQGSPKHVQALLKQMRQVIRAAAPKAEEAISYGIPTFKLNGNLVHFAGYEKHIGFYPGALGISAFKKELSGYTTSKGTVQFGLDKPLPLALVRKITAFRVKQNMQKKKK